MGGSTIIRTKGLTKCYDTITAVKALNLEIREGEVFGLLGPNGAGKTTTTLMLLGLTEPTEGTAAIDGHDCTRDSIAVKRIVGYLPDSVGFYPDLTGRENLRFTGQLNGLEPSECEERAEQLLKRVGMVQAADRKTGEYSRGMKQRLGIADVLMKDPKVIIMDEPTLGIDPEGMRELIALIRELSVKDGRTILISSHQLYQVQQICDRVGLFVEGKLIACGKIEELAEQVGRSRRFVKNDLQKMISSRWFKQGHLDRQGTCLIVSEETYRQYLESEKQLELRRKEEQERARRAQEESRGLSDEVREMMEAGKAYIEKIKRSNDAIPGEEISNKISHMQTIVERIFERVKEYPDCADELRRFMDYYLPTTVKLLDAYEELDRQPVQGENIRNGKLEIEKTLDTLNLAFEKLLDSLFEDTAWDVATDISVLQTMLAQEGLTEQKLKAEK